MKGMLPLMRRICSIVISVICMITFNVGLTDCAPVSVTIVPTQLSSSPAVDNTEATDYGQYIKKVWIVKNWYKGACNYSFSISKIANGEIQGKFATGDMAAPGYYYYLHNHLGDLTGTINNGIAECQFSDKDGNKGNVRIVFKTTDEIEATITYVDKSQRYKDYSLDGTFLFRPYNLKDIDRFEPIIDQCFTVDLNSWGTVNFVSGKLVGRHIPMVFYLTNKDGDVLYNFGNIAPDNMNVEAVSFQDVNKDGLMDIIIIIGFDGGSARIATVLFQQADGSFIIDGGLNAEINVSGNNKDIETITDYLSKKI